MIAVLSATVFCCHSTGLAHALNAPVHRLFLSALVLFAWGRSGETDWAEATSGKAKRVVSTSGEVGPCSRWDTLGGRLGFIIGDSVVTFREFCPLFL